MANVQLHFNGAEVLPLIEYSESHPEERRSPYGQGPRGAACPAGLWLVNDHGCYLMTNCAVPIHRVPVVYAQGYRPDEGRLEGDDFAAVIPAQDLDKRVLLGGELTIRVER